MLNQDALSQLRQLKDQFHPDRNLQTGTVRGSRSTFGFVNTDTGTSYFLAPDQMARVMPGDRVEFFTEEQAGSGERALLESLLESNLKRLTGKCEQRGRNLFLNADDPFLNRRLLIPPKRTGNARPGDWVVAQLLRHPFKDGKSQAAVVAVIGNDDTAWLARRYGIAKHQLPEHNDETTTINTAQARYRDALEQPNRIDLTDIPFITIDDDSTLDLDDALYARADGDGWRLLTAVADVAELVTTGDPIDRYAMALTQTAYFPGAELPMLPPPLAHDLLSLVADERRLAIICELDIAADGAVTNRRFFEAIITSATRLNYQQAGSTVAAGESLPAGVSDSLSALDALAHRRWQWRHNHQLVQGDRADYKLVADTDGALSAIVRIERTGAHRIVEEAMLTTNQAAADTLAEANAAGIFVRHSGFRDDQLSRACQLAATIDAAGDWRPDTLAKLSGFRDLMRQAQTTGEPPLAARLTRMLSRAELATTPGAHFGLGTERYTTVTSPIRRYQDLLTQRSLKALLRGTKVPVVPATELPALQQRSAILRRAVSEAEQWLQCRYLGTHANSTHRALAIDVGNYGIRAALEDNGIIGQIDRQQLDGKWRFDTETRQLIGPNRIIKPGQHLPVHIRAVDSDQRQVQLTLAE